MLIITALFCRIMFRYGNKPIEEGQNIVFKFGTVRPRPWSKWQSRYYHWRLGVSWMGNFIFFAVGLWYMSAIALCYGRAQTDLMLEGWLTSTCISWSVMKPSNPITRTPTLTLTLTLNLIPTVTLTLTLTLARFIMEPGFIIVLITLPCLCQNQYIDTLNDRLNDIGCDISMFLG